MQLLSDQLNQRFQDAFTQAFGTKLQPITPLVVIATNSKFGDYQCNVALPLAKTLKKSPRDIAQTLIDYLEIEDICETPEIAGAGFINLKLKSNYLEKQLQQIQADARLGVEKAQPVQRVVIDFSSPNIAKDMHVGHLRSTIIGDCIARILEFRGHDVLRLNHVGDWGTQFGMLIAHLKEQYPHALTTANALEIRDLVTFYQQAKQRFKEDEAFQETARKEVVKLQSGEPESRQAWQLLCEQSRSAFQDIYHQLDIHLQERGESFYNSLLPEMVKSLEQRGLLTEDQGAKCVFLEGFTNKAGDPLPLIVQKYDGGYNYATTDLAALKYRIEQDKATRLIYVTDAGQSNHFAQFFQVAKRAGFLTDDIEVVHVPFGIVLGEDGKKISTSSGESVKLKDLLNKSILFARQDLETRLKDEGRTETENFINQVSTVVGISSVKYADLSQNRTSKYMFSYQKMLELQGNTAPYMLYAYARIQSISREGQINYSELTKTASILLKETEEIELGKSLLQFGEVIQEVELTLFPNRLCDYLYELSKQFNRFYENCPVLKAEEPIKASRLLLSYLTAQTLKLGLSLLGIPVLERM